MSKASVVTDEIATIPLVAQSSVSKGRSNLNTRLINWYVAMETTGQGKYQAVIYPTPGLLPWATITPPSNPNNAPPQTRGAIYALDRLFTVVLNQFGYITVVGATVTFFPIATLTTYGNEDQTQCIYGGCVKFAAIENQIIVIDGSEVGIHYNYVTQVATTLNWTSMLGQTVNPWSITAQDGYFIINNLFFNTFFISAVNDGTTWDSLASAEANQTGDPIVAVQSYNGKLYFLCHKSTELWYNAALTLTNTTDFIMPFEKIQGGTVAYGTNTINSVQCTNEGILFLNENLLGFKEIVQLSDVTVTVMSTIDTSSYLSEIESTTNGEALAYQQNGINFYQITFPDAERTFLANLNDKTWSEKTTSDSGNNIRAHLAKWHVFFNGQNIVGSRESFNILELNQFTYADLTEVPLRTLLTPPVWEQNKYFILNMINIDCSVGESTATSPEDTLRFRFTKDGGRTYSPVFTRNLGQPGEYTKRVIIQHAGMYQTCQMEISTTTTGFIAIYGATAHIIMQDDLQ